MTHYTNTNNPIDFPKSENKMNERIQELAEQAGIYVFDDLDENHYWVFEKFAELIVRECANISDIAEPYKAHDLILKHFGVK